MKRSSTPKAVRKVLPVNHVDQSAPRMEPGMVAAAKARAASYLILRCFLKASVAEMALKKTMARDVPAMAVGGRDGRRRPVEHPHEEGHEDDAAARADEGAEDGHGEADDNVERRREGGDACEEFHKCLISCRQAALWETRPPSSAFLFLDIHIICTKAPPANAVFPGVSPRRGVFAGRDSQFPPCMRILPISRQYLCRKNMKSSGKDRDGTGFSIAIFISIFYTEYGY